MNERQQQILEDLDSRGASRPRTLKRNDLVGYVNCTLNGERLSVCVTKRRFDYLAAVSIGGLVCSTSGKTPSDAVMLLGRELRARRSN